MGTRAMGALRLRAAPVVLVVAGVAFAATSRVGKTYDLTPDDPQTTYSLSFAMSKLADRMDATGLWHRGAETGDRVTYHVVMEDGCRFALFSASGDATSTGITLVQLGTRSVCIHSGDGKGRLQKAFEEEVLARLRHDVEPYTAHRLPKGDRLDYNDGQVFQRTVAIPPGEISRAIDTF